MGANTVLLGQIGKDFEGESYINYLQKENVNTDFILKHETEHTGQALIFQLTGSGDNSIVIVGGANMGYSDNFKLPAFWANQIEKADVLLMQREIPERVNLVAARFAKECAVS